MIGPIQSVGHFARNHKLPFLCGLVVILFIMVGLFAPWIAPKDPRSISLQHRLEPPSVEFPLGTDNHGRDLLSRIIYGARVSLFIGLSATSLGTVIGVSLGLIAAWYEGLRMVIMRLMDVFLTFPGIIVALTIIAVLGPAPVNVVLAIGFYQIAQFARLSYGLALSVKQETYVEAAVSIGASDWRILSRHILPNIAGPIIVQSSLLIPSAIMTAAGLSFLGLGVPPPTPEWGRMIQGSITWLRQAPHMLIFPGLALLLVVFSSNMLGDGLQDALNPQSRR